MAKRKKPEVITPKLVFKFYDSDEELSFDPIVPGADWYFVEDSIGLTCRVLVSKETQARFDDWGWDSSFKENENILGIIAEAGPHRINGYNFPLKGSYVLMRIVNSSLVLRDDISNEKLLYHPDVADAATLKFVAAQEKALASI